MEKEKNTQPHVTKNYHFEHVGQYIDYIHTQYVTIDKDAGIQISEVNNQHSSQPTPQPTQATPTRTIESFASMFTFGYCERRKNDFENMLALIQEPQWEPKDRARFALAIYQSDNLVPKTKPNTFKEWYQICCETFGWEQGNYEPRKLTDNKATQQIKAYL